MSSTRPYACPRDHRPVLPGFGPPVHRQGLILRAAGTESERAQLLALRALTYRGDARACDVDDHDPGCLHLWIGPHGEAPLATMRLRHHGDAASVMAGYTARFFDLGALARLPGPVLEPGRLALHPAAPAAGLMRLIWTGIARMVMRTGAARLIGCTSLPGAVPARHTPILSHLARHHLAPTGLRPSPLGASAPLPRPAETTPTLPPILRFYLSLGGWVSDRVALDHDLDTCVLFTCVETAAMPPAQARLMQALAAH